MSAVVPPGHSTARSRSRPPPSFRSSLRATYVEQEERVARERRATQLRVRLVQRLQAAGHSARPSCARPGTATFRQFVTRLETDVDLYSVPHGPARLGVRRDSEDWQLLAVRLQ